MTDVRLRRRRLARARLAETVALRRAALGSDRTAPVVVRPAPTAAARPLPRQDGGHDPA